MTSFDENLRRIREINQSIQTLYYRPPGLFTNSLLDNVDTTLLIRDLQESELVLYRDKTPRQVDSEDYEEPGADLVKQLSTALEQLKDDRNEDASVRLGLMYQRLLRYTGVYRIDEQQRATIQEGLNEATRAVTEVQELRGVLESMQEELIVWNRLGAQYQQRGGEQSGDLGRFEVGIYDPDGEDVKELLAKEELELEQLVSAK